MSDDGTNTPAVVRLRGLLYETKKESERLHMEWQIATTRRMAFQDAIDEALHAEAVARKAELEAAQKRAKETI